MMMNYYKKRSSCELIKEDKKINIVLRKAFYEHDDSYPEGIMMELQTKEVLPE